MAEMQAHGLLRLLKVLADENRLKIISLLHNAERNGTEIAALLGLSEPTVSHHLIKLREVGLVQLRAEGNQRWHRLNAERLAEFKRLVQQIELLRADLPDDRWIDALDWPEDARKVLRDYTSDGRLRQIPTRQKKLLVILNWIASKFQPGATYTEGEVNAIIRQVHDDFATLRRDLVDFGYLRRQRGGETYWLAPADDRPLPAGE